ncbi:MAG: GDSL-type esterase/lipase family protein [Campylobacterota bacterium]|nr:GDSL-type esterase/lipase family protein [Campylobacterota bacterium]
MSYIRVYLLLTILVFFTACGGSSIENHTAAAQAPKNEDISESVRVACVGDSVTYGYGLDNRHTESYPSQLSALAGAEWSIENFGLTSATVLKKGNVPYSKSASFAQSQAYNPEIVVIILGTNDSKSINWKYKSEFISDYTALIESYQALPSSPEVWIAYPTPAYSGTAGITDRVIREEIIPMIDIVAQNTGVEVLDLYSQLSDSEELFPDTIHPNVEGSNIIAQIVYAAIY